VEPGFRWIKNPAAISPVWLEKPERIAALAMLTVVGLLVYGLIQGGLTDRIRSLREVLLYRAPPWP
jgi:transposase